MLFINEDQVSRLLSMDDALRALEQAFGGLGTGKAVNIPRSRVRLPGHTLHVMSGGMPALNLTGLKAYTTTRHGANFVVLLFQTDTGELLAAIEADRLGQMRTGAASGVATKYMAREDAETVGVIGTGWQARSQLAAVCAVCAVTSVKAYGRDRARRETYCREMSEALGVPVQPVEEAPRAAQDVDIVLCMTNTNVPVIDGSWLEPGQYIISVIGSNIELVKSGNLDKPRREIDDGTLDRMRERLLE